MHNRKSLTREKPRGGKLSLVEERRRSEWDRGFRNKKEMVGGIPPEDSDIKYHDTREYNVDGNVRTVPGIPEETKAAPLVKKNKETAS